MAESAQQLTSTLPQTEGLKHGECHAVLGRSALFKPTPHFRPVASLGCCNQTASL